MRRILLATFLLSLNLSLATPDAERRHVYLLRRSDICTANNLVACDSNCMPLGSICCRDGSGSYCPTDTVCVPDGCCPTGESCVGGGGTMTVPHFLTSMGSLPTDPPKTTVTHGGAYTVPTLDAISTVTFATDPARPKPNSAVSSGWSRSLGISTVLLAVRQLAF